MVALAAILTNPGGCANGNVVSPPLRASFYAHQEDISQVVFLPADEELISAGQDGRIVRWDLRTQRPSFTFRQPWFGFSSLALATKPLRLVATTPQSYIIIADEVPNLRAWDLGADEPRFVPVVSFAADARGDRYTDAVLSRDGRVLVALSSDGDVSALDPDTGDQLSSNNQATLHAGGQSCLGEEFSFAGLTMSLDGTRVAARCENGLPLEESLRIWDLSTNDGPRHISITAHAQGLAFSRDGRRLFQRDDATGDVYIWDVASRQLVDKLELKGCTSQDWTPLLNAHPLAISADDRYVASGSGNCVVVWDLVAGKERFVVELGEGWPARAVAFSNDGKLLATGDYRRINVWSLEDGPSTPTVSFVNERDPEIPIIQTADVLAGHAGDVTSLSTSQSNGLLLTGSKDRVVRLYDVRRKMMLGRLRSHDQPVVQVYLLADGERALSSSASSGETDTGTIILWDLGSSEVIATARIEKFSGQFTVSEADERVYFPQGTEVGQWDLSSPKDVHIPVPQAESEAVDGSSAGQNEEIRCLAVAPDGKHVVLGLPSGVELRDLASGAALRAFQPNPDNPGFVDSVTSLEFSADGQKLLAKAYEEAYVWDVESGEELARIAYPYYPSSQRRWYTRLGSTRFSPDSQHVVVGSGAWVYLWDIASDRQVASLALTLEFGQIGEPVRDALLMPRTATAVSAQGKSVRIWDLSGVLDAAP